MNATGVNPEQIGRYPISEVIGVGGFATVYRAVDDRLEGEVALKVLAENHSLDAQVREQFLTEGRVLRRVDSPHVVRVLDLGQTDRQQPYLVLELADRGDLAGRVEQLRTEGWAANIDDVLAVAGPLATALAAVHRAGVIHRDLSPSNLLLRSTLSPQAAAGTSALVAADERLVLADLGLSKDLARSSGLTVAGGTEGFRPPEQRGGPSSVDTRADLWASSALVVWLLAGRPPKDQDDAAQLLATSALPEAAHEVVIRGLSADPDHRQDDVTTWYDQLYAALRPLPAPPVPRAGLPAKDAEGDRTNADERRSAPTPSPSARSSWLRVAVAAALALVIGAGVTAWVLTGSNTQVTVDDGDVEVVATDGDLQVTLTGPETVTAGQTATFTASVQGATSYAWVSPEGEMITDAPTLQVQTHSAGRATVTVFATTSGGRDVIATHLLEVHEP